jgi:type I restriction enzyme M protein
MPQAKSTDQLWQILDHLRGDPGCMPHELGTQLAALIYLRWADFQEAECEAIAAFDDTEYSPVLPSSLHWRTWHAFGPDQLLEMVSHRLPPVLAELGNARHNPLATHLHRLAEPLAHFERWSAQSLVAIVQWLAEKPFETPSDRHSLLEAFDRFLTLSIKGTDGSPRENIDPAWVSELVVALGRPAAGDRVYDPCFGSAGFLVAACDYVRASAEGGFRRGSAPSLSICGIDINASAFVIGLTRLALSGVDYPQLELGNSLERTASDSPHKEGFDLVVANPPWGMRMDVHGLDHFPIETSDSTGLFIQHALSQLRPDGRAVIVVPQGFLFRSGPDQRLREFLLQERAVETVIGLPSGAFLPYTGIAASMLVLRGKGPSERIRMVDAEGLLQRDRRGMAVAPEAIQEVARLARSTETNDRAWSVSRTELEEIEWDLTPRRRDQSGLESILEAIGAKAPVFSLKDCCQILSGRSIKSSELLDGPFLTGDRRGGGAGYGDGTGSGRGEGSGAGDGDGSGDGSGGSYEKHPVAYIRIGDLRGGYVGRGEKWLGRDAVDSLNPKWKLKAGDVLLSKSGTIGKAAVVRNGAVGAVAANGLIVLRVDSDQIDPHYLTAYLASSECHAWLEGRARGAVIRHLSKKVLHELLVPVPPIQIQQRVAEHYREHGVDVITYLSQLLLEGEGNEIVEWLDGALRHLKSAEAGKSHDLEPLLHSQVFEGGFKGLRNAAAHGQTESPLSAWVIALHAEVVSTVRNSDDVPPGPALYSLLQQADSGLMRAQDAITGHLPHANRARELSQLVGKRINAAMARMVDSADITVTADTSRLDMDAVAAVELTITNNGVLPLRDLDVSTKPWPKAEQVGYLAERASKTIHVDGPTPRDKDTFTLALIWNAVAMNGTAIEGSREIAFELVDHTDQESLDEDLGASPYVCGDPITPKRSDVFVGREELLARIRRQISQSGNVVLLEGNRRAGKTSILKHLDGLDGVPGWLGVYTSLQGAEGSRDGVVGVPTDEVFRTLAREIAKSVHTLGGDTPLPNGDVLPAEKKPLVVPRACRQGISSDAPFSDFTAYVEVVLELLDERNLGLLVMLDEFDKLQEGIDNGVTSPQVPENIRYLVQDHSRFSAVLTGSRRLKRLREEYWSALYGLGTRIGVTSLDDPAAERLITGPVQGRLTYSRESIRRCVHLTAGQPFLLQCLCNRVFDMAAQLKTRSITGDIVDRAASALIEDNEHFASLWDYAGSARRRLLMAMCHRQADGPDLMRLGVIQERLSADGIEVADEDVIADLDYLRELELIELVGESSAGHYELAIPLMGIWVDKQRDVDAVVVGARMESENDDA